jgi:hypothetical protein
MPGYLESLEPYEFAINLYHPACYPHTSSVKIGFEVPILTASPQGEALGVRTSKKEENHDKKRNQDTESNMSDGGMVYALARTAYSLL